MTRAEILSGVCLCLAKVVDRDAGSIREGDKIIDDLGADSLDLLDLVFQLEQHFGIRIKTRDLERRAQEELGDSPLEVDGVYTEPALDRLRRSMSEVPPEELAFGLRTAELPYRFRVATFVNLVERLMQEQGRG
jgi:acyl carrier protein